MLALAHWFLFLLAPSLSPGRSTLSTNQSIYPLIDFSIDNYNFSVKASGKKTNTISPSSVVSNNNFKKYIHTLPQTSHFRKYYSIFMILNSSSVMEGPFDLIYGNKTTGGILKELIQKPLNQLLLEKQTNPRDTLVDLETKIEKIGRAHV